MLSTNPSYDNRTTASTLKMQIRTVQRSRVQLNASDDPLEVLKRKPKAENIMPPHNFKRTLATYWSPVNSDYLSWNKTKPKQKTFDKGKQQNSLGNATNRYKSWTHWTTSFGHTSKTSPTWPPTTPKPAWSPPSAEYSPSSRQRLWKKHAPSFGSVSRRWLRLKAATLNRCQLYYIIKLPELIFSITVLK